MGCKKLKDEQLKDVNGGGGAIHNDNSGDVDKAILIGGSLETPTTSEQEATTEVKLLF